MTYQERRAIRRAAGLCTWCTHPAGLASLCKRHQEQQRNRNARRPARAKHCRTCGKLGHNSRSHR